MTTGDPFLDQIIAAASAGGSGSQPPAGYLGGITEFEPRGPVDVSGQFRGPFADRGGVADGYTDGMQHSVLSSMNTEELARFQDTAVAMGLAKEVMPGRIDDNTLGAMERLMAVANRQSVRWQEVLDGLIANGGMLDGSGRRGEAEFEPEPYLAPDYATLAQEVKATFRQRLGRDPDDAEMAHLVAELQGWDKANYGARTQAGEMAFDQAQEPGQQGGGTVQTVDPLARFQERFESLYRNELDFVEDKAEAAETQQFMEGTAQTVSQAARSRF